MDHSYDFPKSKFYQAMMTAFFVGFFATVICLVVNIVYRDKNTFPLSSFINVSSLIFLINLLFPVIGMIYYWFLSRFKKADVVYVVVFVLLTVFCGWRAEAVHRSDNHAWNEEFKTLLLTMVLILGLSAALIVPLLYNSKRFREQVL